MKKDSNEQTKEDERLHELGLDFEAESSLASKDPACLVG